MQDRDHIEQLINGFYEKVKSDELTGPFFEKANVNWPAHLPIM